MGQVRLAKPMKSATVKMDTHIKVFDLPYLLSATVSKSWLVQLF